MKKKHNQIVNYYSSNLDWFFKKKWVEILVIAAIILSVITAIETILYDSVLFERLNWFFTGFFAIELILRYFTYQRKGNYKTEYIKDWWLDWIATIPWAFILIAVFPGGNLAFARLLRLPRILRILRFKSMSRLHFYRWMTYRFKRLLEASIFNQLFALIVVSLILIGLFDLVFNSFHVDMGHGSNLWFSAINMISSDGLFEVESQPVIIKIIVLILSFVGIIIFDGILIAIIVSKLLTRLENIKNGYGEVFERNHFIILGWNEVIPHILNELELYCQIEKKRLMKVLILLESIDSKAAHLLSSRPHVKVILRTGESYSTEALKRISLQHSRSIIVFGNSKDEQTYQHLADSQITKTLLTAANILQEYNPNTFPSIVLNYSNNHRIDFLKNYLGKSSLNSKTYLSFSDPVFFSSTLITSMCINKFTYEIYNELLSAKGNEFHSTVNIRNRLKKENIKFEDINLVFTKAIPVGITTRNSNEKQSISLLPQDYYLNDNDFEIITLANNSLDVNYYNEDEIQKNNTEQILQYSVPEITETINGTYLIIGINSKLQYLLKEISKLECDILVLDNQSDDDFNNWKLEHNIKFTKLNFKECNFKNEKEIANIIIGEDIKKIIILADGYLVQKDVTPEQIDAETLTRLLMINELFFCKEKNTEIIIEILTPESENLVKNNIGNCSYVVGPLFMGKLITTFTLYPELEQVFRRLIEKGNEDIICIPLITIQEANTQILHKNIIFEDLIKYRPLNYMPLGYVNNNCGISNSESKTVILNPDKKQILPANSQIVFLKVDAI